MFGLRSAVLVVSLLLLIAQATQAAEPLRLRVLSYNIHHAEGVDGKLDLERIARVIASAKPDLVALQEVDERAARSGSVDQAAELASLTDLQAVFGANIPLQGGRYGNAVLSRWPIARHKNHELPNVDDGEQRGVLEVEVTLPDSNQPLVLLATHFDHRRDERERLASAEAVNKLAKRHADRPLLLAGDLNATPESETLKQLFTVWKPANDQPRPTVPVARPNAQIDYILLAPAERWKVVEVQVLDEAVASDHRPILAVLELLPKP
jgi:endonuclease/exonuclease/phosphatase family metal-dependent hydrolase